MSKRERKDLENSLDGAYWRTIQPPAHPPPPPRRAMQKGPIHIRRPPAPPVSKMPLARLRPPTARQRVFKKLPKKPLNPRTEVEEPSSESDEPEPTEGELRRNFIGRIVLEGEEAVEEAIEEEEEIEMLEQGEVTSISSTGSATERGCINCGGRPGNYLLTHAAQRAALRHLNLRLCHTCAIIPRYAHEIRVAYRIRNLNPNPFGPQYPPLRSNPPSLTELAARATPSEDARQHFRDFASATYQGPRVPPEKFMHPRFYDKEIEDRSKKRSHLAEDEPS